jgi:hypothetical protein
MKYCLENGFSWFDSSEQKPLGSCVYPICEGCFKEVQMYRELIQHQDDFKN